MRELPHLGATHALPERGFSVGERDHVCEENAAARDAAAEHSGVRCQMRACTEQDYNTAIRTAAATQILDSAFGPQWPVEVLMGERMPVRDRVDNKCLFRFAPKGI